MDTYSYKEKSRLILEETIDILRNKPVKSTYVERLLAAGKAYDLYHELPQPLYFGYGVRFMIENVSCPVMVHDILLGRAAEWVPNDEEEAKLIEIRKLYDEKKFFMVETGHITFDWETILKIGISGYIQKAEEKLGKCIAEGADKDTLLFLQGMILVYKSFRRYMIRYSEAAEKIGLTEAAEVSRNIADHPPKTFREGIQLILYVTHMFSIYVAKHNATLTCGRIDDLLCSLYEKDLATGCIDRETAGYIIDDFNCKCAIVLGRGEHQMSHNDEETQTGWFRNPMYDSPTYVIIGGRSNFRDHRENPLTLLFAERIHPRLENPTYVFRRTDDVDATVWDTVCDKLRKNATLLIYNDETMIPAMENAGIEPYDAVNYTIHGCNWPDIQGISKSVYRLGGPIPKAMMSAMFDENGKPTRAFRCIDDVYEAVREYWDESMKDKISMLRKQYGKNRTPVSPQVLECVDCFLRGPLETAQKNNLAVKYPQIYCALRNIGTAADMLAALETVVFGDDPVPMNVLADALKQNFEGYEVLHKRLKSAPKFGRDDEIADRHAVRMMSMLQDITDEKAVNPETGEHDLFIMNLTITDMYHIDDGANVGATPDGRMAGAPLSENLSPTEGCSESVTSLLKSVSQIPFNRISSGAFNVRMSKHFVSDEEGLTRLKALLEAYFRNGGMQLQFSAADTDELRDAQIHPEKYRDLMVRITGYSAVFVDMSPSAQNEIIRRDELS